jgi:hypothetical protein
MPATVSPGTCTLCGTAVTKRTAARHLNACAPTHDGSSGPSGRVLRFRVQARGGGPWWLDVEARASTALASLDTLLRDLWLECCGHLSEFEVGAYRYVGGGGPPSPFGRDPSERTMSAKLYDVFHGVGAVGRYEYDFGSTTELVLKVTGERNGRLGRAAARLVARNDPPVWPCGECGAPGTAVCAAHDVAGSPFVCAAHESTHPCEDEAFLPVVNSPRMGVCGYSG